VSYDALASKWSAFLALAEHREWESRKTRWALIGLLEAFQDVECTLQRDRFYTLLGIASDGDDEAFEPDYEGSLETIVHRVACVFVRQGRALHLLCRAGLSSQPDRFPSWIPDWTKKRAMSLHEASDLGASFAASGSSTLLVQAIPNTDELSIEGYCVDKIQEIGKHANLPDEWRQFFDEVDILATLAKTWPESDSREDLLWKVPIAGNLYPTITVDGNVDLHLSYKKFRKTLKDATAEFIKEHLDAAGDDKKPESGAIVGWKEYAVALQDCIQGWRFIITERGFAGLVPGNARVGDIISVFCGASVPFLMRASQLRHGAQRLVGECYVYGIMEGESMRFKDIKRTQLRLH